MAIRNDKKTNRKGMLNLKLNPFKTVYKISERYYSRDLYLHTGFIWILDFYVTSSQMGLPFENQFDIGIQMPFEYWTKIAQKFRFCIWIQDQLSDNISNLNIHHLAAVSLFHGIMYDNFWIRCLPTWVMVGYLLVKPSLVLVLKGEIRQPSCSPNHSQD